MDKRGEGFSDLGTAIKKMLGELGIEKKFRESELVQAWPELMGPTIASRTGRIYINKSVLYVEITSAPLRNELHSHKELIIKKFSEEWGESPVSDIRFL